MESLSVSDREIRMYLLDQLSSESQRSKIEQQIIVSEVFYERVLIIETALIEDFLEESLSQSARRSFLRRFRFDRDLASRTRLIKLLRCYKLWCCT